MTINADERLELRALAQAAWGDRGAELLMAGLAGADLEPVEERLTLRVEIARAETHAELGELRGEFAELKGQVRDDIGEVKAEIGRLYGYVGAEVGALKGDIGELKGEIGELKGLVGSEIGAIRGEIGKQNKLFVFSIIACFAGVAAIVFGAMQIAA
jgi:hypothetical protein